MAAKMTSDDEGDEGVLHSCEICGQSNLAVGALRRHVESAHIRYVTHRVRFQVSPLSS